MGGPSLSVLKDNKSREEPFSDAIGIRPDDTLNVVMRTTNITPELRSLLLDALKTYLNAPRLPDEHTPVEIEAELDRNRREVIEKFLRPLLADFLQDSLPVSDFKRRIDGLNKQNNYWGFRGIKGQMFFNMLVNCAGDETELGSKLKLAIKAPSNFRDAVDSLELFENYVKQTGEQFVAAGGEPRSKPNSSSIPFFLSYFWQIQQPDVWPVYYTNTVQMLESMNLFEATGETIPDYLTYKDLHEKLVELFSEAAGRKFSLYDVEHVFWFKSGRLLSGATPALQPESAPTSASAPQSALITAKQPPSVEAPFALDGYVPPIVAAIPRLALNDPADQEKARLSGTTLERALEKSINAAFTILGYDAHLLGQGKGRVPDGLAIAVDESYALLWDAKARSGGYKMGTDDRSIREYIETQSKHLKRSRGVRNIYYLIISSGFSDDFEDLIRSLKMETHVNEVCLLEASALVAVVDQKLRAPLTISLGSDGIQRLFSSSGKISLSDVVENLS